MSIANLSSSPALCVDGAYSGGLDWVAGAIIRCLPNSSPVVAYNQLYRDAAEITPGLGKVINESFKSVLAPMPLKCLMDIDDAKECLNFSTKTVKTRAQLRKRKAAEEAEAAQRAEEQRKQVIGAARMAKKAKIFERPTKSERVVDNCGRIKYF